jgi:type II secretory pathway pseudopilin PulG
MRGRDSERGFTLAGLLVILTVLAVVVAYTVPPAWSLVMKREREKQTVWVMRQYARAIYEFQRKRNALPVSLDQLKEQTNPRVLRALYPNPLTGEMDWVLVPPGTAAGGMPAPGMPPPPPSGLPPPQQPTIGQPGQSTLGGNPKDYRGPFVGVRPSQTGEAYIQLNGADRYENWVYTVVELQQEIARAGGVPQSVPNPKPIP